MAGMRPGSWDQSWDREWRTVVVSGGDPRDRGALVDALQRAGWTVAGTEGSPGTRVTDEEAAILVRVLARGEPPRVQSSGPACRLTPREQEVLARLAAGATDVGIARDLEISVSTVRSHLDRIREKTGRRRRSELTRLAIESGLVDARPAV